jgi:hypothetical protein
MHAELGVNVSESQSNNVIRELFTVLARCLSASLEKAEVQMRVNANQHAYLIVFCTLLSFLKKVMKHAF